MGVSDMVLLDGSGGYEDSLRSLGAFLDTHHARSVYIREVPTGLIVRARVVQDVTHRLDGDWKSLERTFSADDIEAERAAARGRRGSGHVAGPIERALRLIGHQAHDRRVAGLTIIQHHTDDGWLVWHDDHAPGRADLFSLTAAEIMTLDAVTRASVGRQPLAAEL